MDSKDVMVTVAANEIWSYLSDVNEADTENTCVPYRWRRESEKTTMIVFGAESYKTTQTCYRIIVNVDKVSLIECKSKDGEPENKEVDSVELGDPKVWDRVRAFINRYRPKPKGG